MNNFYTLHSLVAELRYKISGKKIKEVCTHRKDQLDLFLHPDHEGKLTFSASSPGTAFFWDPRPGKPSRNTVSFFSEIYGNTVSTIELVSREDRLVRLRFTDTALELLLMPFSSRPNVFLVEDGMILSAFKNPEGNAGKPAPQAKAPEKQLEQGTQQISLPSSDEPLKNRVIAIDRKFPRSLLPDLADTCNLDDLEPNELRDQIVELQQYLLNPGKIAITAEGRLSLLPERYLSHPPDRTFESTNEAVRTLFLMQNREFRLLPRKNDLVKKLQKRLGNLEKKQKQFDKEPERFQNADTYEHYGHLLMSRPDATSPVDADSVTVPDWSDEGREVTIPVKKGMSPVDQARKYYDKASRIRQEIAMSGKIKKQLAGQKDEAVRLLEDLEPISHPPELDKWVKKNEERLQELGLRAAGTGKQTARPYRVITAGNSEIWIGKNARSNDELLARSHKEDIWMHARGASGSHVILRNQGRTAWPDSGLVLKAASFAAAFSQLSGSSLVPVMIAKRKHVRKPKGASPGQVVVTNERVEMVGPKKPDIPDS